VQAIVAPRREDDVHALAEAVGALLRRHAERRELVAIEAAPGAPVHAAAGEDVDQRDFLGEPQRIVEGRERHGEADPDIPRARGDVRGHDVDGRAHAVRAEVMLGQPHAVVARLVHDLDARERPLVHRGERDAPRPREELQDADLHAPRHAAGGAATTAS
jgi:hypothetical protein